MSAPSASAATQALPASLHRAAVPARVVHGMGLLPLPGRLAASSSAPRVPFALPASVDLSSNAPAIGDQGAVGSCATWAIGYGILGYYSRTQPHAGAPFAALSVYNLVNGGGDNGSRSSDIYAVLKTKGIVEKSVWTHAAGDYLSQPNTTEAANALTHRTNDGSYLFVGGNQGTAAQTKIETALAAGTPVAIGLPVYSSFEALNSSSSVMTAAKATGSVLGGHMVAAYGYDATGVKIANSWGTSWGNAGWATLAWDFVDKYVNEASTPGSFLSATAAGAPTVSAVTPGVVLSSGGGTIAVQGTNLASLVTDGTAVQLVNTANSSQKYSLTNVSAGGSTLTASLPTSMATGSYRLVVTNTYGASPDSAGDAVTVQAKPAFTIATTAVPVSGGLVTLTGSGFGTAADAFTAAGWSATVNGKAAKLSWVSDTALTLAVPGGTIGTSPSIVLKRGDFTSDPNTTSVTYGAAITAVVATPDAAGVVLRVTGKALDGSTGWKLTNDADTTKTANLSLVADTTQTGVVLSSDSAALVRLPAAPGPAGVYRISFTPAGGVPFADTPVARYTYKVPTVSSGAPATVSSSGGTTVVFRGTGLTAVDRTSSTAVTLTSVADSSKTVNATVTDQTATSLTVTVPAAPTSGGSPLTGAYTVTMSTPLGAVVIATAAGTLTYVTPFSVSVASGAKVPAAGGAVLVSGTGFGADRPGFTAGKVTAKVNGKGAGVTWISDTSIAVLAPAGTPGTTASIVVYHNGVGSTSIDLPYVASITGLSTSTGPSAGGTVVTVSGKGFGGSSTWVIKRVDGTTLATLPVVGSLDGVSSGVVLVSDTKVAIRMPAAGASFLPVLITFTPDTGLYPGATSATTSKAVFTYSDLG